MILPFRWRYPFATSIRSKLFRDYSSLGSMVLSEPGTSMIVLVTSAKHGEGKTYTSVNLSANLALRGKNVLLVEADANNASLSRLFGLQDQAGLLDALRGSEPAICPVAVPAPPGLHVLGLGQDLGADVFQLYKERLPAFLAEQAEHYDVVFVDAAAIGGNDEVSAAVEAANGVLLVVRARTTTTAEVIAARDGVGQNGGHLLGVVMNAYREYIPRAIREWL